MAVLMMTGILVEERVAVAATPNMSTLLAASAGYKAFSSASLWDASVVLGHFDFTALVGEDEEPLEAPPASAP